MEDEEQPMEVSLEDSLSADSKSEAHNIIRPPFGSTKRVHSEVSRLYDRGAKGYLDETELALRQMDHHGKGHLDLDTVYSIMQALREEQKLSAKLMDTIRREHKSAIALKKGIIGLCFFAVLLAVANIGTSFAAASLAKETSVSSGDLVSLNDGVRIGTTSKLVEVAMKPVQDATRRMLKKEMLACEDSGTTRTCSVQGEMDYIDAVWLYRQFCPSWPLSTKCNVSGGVSEVLLNCNGVTSSIFGGSKLPNGSPVVDESGYTYTIFPTQKKGYQSRQTLFSSQEDMPDGCDQDFTMGMYCQTDRSPCLVFAYFDPTCFEPDGTPMELALCGDVE